MRIYFVSKNLCVAVDDSDKTVIYLPLRAYVMQRHVLRVSDKDIDFLHKMYVKQGYTVQ